MLSFLRDIVFAQFEATHKGYVSEFLHIDLLKCLLRKFDIGVTHLSLQILTDFLQLSQIHYQVKKIKLTSNFERKFEEMSYNFCLACF